METEETSKPALRTQGDLVVAAGAHVHESIHADGRLKVGAGATVDGSASATEGAEVGAGARIAGTLRVVGALSWGDAAETDRAAIKGPVFAGGAWRAASLLATRGIHPAPAEVPS